MQRYLAIAIVMAGFEDATETACTKYPGRGIINATVLKFLPSHNSLLKNMQRYKNIYIFQQVNESEICLFSYQFTKWYIKNL